MRPFIVANLFSIGIFVYLSLLHMTWQAEAEALERQRVQERQRAQRLKDKAACERYKEQWSHDQGQFIWLVVFRSCSRDFSQLTP